MELHCWVVVLTAKMMQLQSEGLDFRGGKWVEHRDKNKLESLRARRQHFYDFKQSPAVQLLLYRVTGQITPIVQITKICGRFATSSDKSGLTEKISWKRQR